MSDQLSLDPQHEARPFTQHRHKSHLPPHERKSNTTVPVTPGISAGTYTESANRLGTKDKLSKDYFSRQSNASSHAQTRPSRHQAPVHAHMRPGASERRSQHKAMALGGTVISATFTVPQLLQYREGSEWVTSQHTNKDDNGN